MPIIIIPTIMAVVLIDESGENKQDTTIPVPAPVKKSTIDCLCLREPADPDNFFRFPNLKQSRLYSNFNYGVVKFTQLSASDTPHQCVFGYIVESSVLSRFFYEVSP